MSSAKVISKEIDLSTRVPSFPGVYGGIVVAATKGAVNVPQLVTSDTQFLKLYTPDESIAVGYDNAYFSALKFLEKSNKLWVVRAAKEALYAGLSLRTFSSSYSAFALGTGLSDPTAYVFDAANDPAIAQIQKVTTVADVASSLNNKYFLISSTTVDYYVWFNVGGAGVDPALVGKTGVAVAIAANATANVVAAAVQSAVAALSSVFTATVSTNQVTITNLVAGAPLSAFAAGNSGFTVAVLTAGLNSANNVDEALLIYAANEGQWANSVGVKVTTYAANPNKVKEPGAFMIEVFKNSNLNVPVETFTCSRVQGAKDGFGKNIFVEDVLTSSNYIRAFNNVAVADTVLPKDVSTVLLMGGGDNGSAVTDAEIIQALDAFYNKDTYQLTVLMDGGHASPAVQLEMDTICQSRNDCVALMSVPYSDEVASDYMTQIVNYRQTDLNLNSSFSALYTPHLKIYDSFNDRNLYASPDGFAGAAISASASNFEIWFPPAGYTRGIVNALEARVKFDEGERDALYDAQINPIRFKAGRGLAIWGQKTLLTRPSSLQSLNVRLMLIVIEPAIAEALEDFLFELNDSTTQLVAKTRVDRYMENIQSRRGVFDFSTICDDTNNTAADIQANRLNLDLYVIPTGSVETIVFRTIVTAAGVSLQQSS